MYMYPDNLKSKATLWLWELRDIGIIGIGCLISVFALSQLGWLPEHPFTGPLRLVVSTLPGEASRAASAPWSSRIP